MKNNFEKYYGTPELLVKELSCYNDDIDCEYCPIYYHPAPDDSLCGSETDSCKDMILKWLKSNAYRDDEWVPVDECLPNDGDEVWATLESINSYGESHRYVLAAIYYEKTGWYLNDGYTGISDSKVKAWMNLYTPRAYQGEK